MSKTISYRGNIPDGEQERIRLKTNDGKTGYKITKFQICGPVNGTTDDELTGQIFKTDQTNNVTSVINFTNSDLLAAAFYNESASSNYGNDTVIIFDNERFNQDIFVTAVDVSGNTNAMNYYIELEVMSLSDLEATYLTLQSVRQITSR
tara:strand:- start:41 stop:487 length:447 start_codon:yes stop_codon:yes gene_type:complete